MTTHRFCLATFLFVLSYPRIYIPLQLDTTPLWKPVSDVVAYVSEGTTFSDSATVAVMHVSSR
jgi:hypothetical protein